MSTPETQQGCIPLVKITAEQKSSLHNEIRPTTVWSGTAAPLVEGGAET